MRPSIYFKERIFVLRRENNSYKNIQLILLKEGFKISVKSIFKICQKYLTKPSPNKGRPCLLNHNILNYLNNIIDSDREIKIIDIQKRIHNEFNIKISLMTIRRAALKLKWVKKTTRYFYFIMVRFNFLN